MSHIRQLSSTHRG